jgi:hypothetical protein
MFEAMALGTDDGLSLTAYTGKPGTPPHDALRLPASWAATNISESTGDGRSLTQGSGHGAGRNTSRGRNRC